MKYIHSKSTRNLALAAIITANVIWGITGFTIKIAVEEVDPAMYIFLRFLFVSVLLIPWALRYFPRDLDMSKWSLLILVGILAGPLNYALVVNGLANTNVSSASFILLASPVIVFILSGIFLKERVSSKTIWGLATAFAGAAITAFGTVGLAIEGVSLLGNMLFFAAILASAITLVLTKKVMEDIDPRFLVWFMATLSLGASLLFVNLENISSQLIGLSTPVIASIAWGVFATTIVAYYCYYFGIKKLRASDVGIFRYVDPLIGAMIGFTILGEPFSALYILGGALVVVGVLLAEAHIPPRKSIFGFMHWGKKHHRHHHHGLFHRM